jgi:cell division protein FtsL
MSTAARQQSYKKHARWLPLFHFFVIPVLLVNVLVATWRLIQLPAVESLFGVVFAVALMAVAFVSRIQALTVQDRLIRLEMRLKLRELLPPDLQSRINELTHRQLVALRFAGDAELPALVRDVLAGKLATSKDIKMQIKNWQADWLRA